jgi:CYTH domain-containing protein
MAKEKKKNKAAKAEAAEQPKQFRSLLGEGNALPPAKEVYNGFEIEKRWVLLTPDNDYTKGSNGVALYDKALQNGEEYKQGYITDFEAAREMLEELKIEIDFKPNTVRLRSIADKTFILTLKDKKETKRREVEWELDKKTFYKFWKLTKGARITKRRYETVIKKQAAVLDAFTDRYLLMAEIEVMDEAQLENLPKLGYDVTTDSKFTNKAMAK